MKRPTHESDAMKLFLADSVAPRLASKLQQLRSKGLRGDQLFVAAAISLSAEMSPEFWADFTDHIKLAEAARDELLRLRAEGKPVPRGWLKALREASARLGFEPMKPWHVLTSGCVGIKVTADLAVDYARKVIVELLDERGRVVERFDLPVAEEVKQ